MRLQFPDLIEHRRQQLEKVASAAAPAVFAALIVLFEPQITAWAIGRQSLLPLIVFLLLASLLHPALRQFLMITLCYGVALMAFRDTFRVKSLVLPSTLDNDLWDAARPLALLLVAGLSTTAAIAETLKPGTVWARRCYFAAAGLYFTGCGFLSYVWMHSWQSIVLCATGVMALIGCLFAPRIVASELEADRVTEVSDEAIQSLVEAAHHRALQAKEWHDSLAREADNQERNDPA